MQDLFGNEIEESPRKQRDWTGNSRGVFSIIGASNHSDSERQSDDYYATPPRAVEMLLELETFLHRILEPSCGGGHIGKVLEVHGFEVDARDLVYRGYGKGGLDFLKSTETELDCDCIQNPPYSKAQEFIEKAISVIGNGHKVAAFLKLTFLEGKNRRTMFEKYPPKVVYVSSSRLACLKNGTEDMAACVAYAWFVWEKGFHGIPSLKWFN